MRHLFPSLLLLAGVASAISPAHAWGAKGHRLVARLAEARLSPQARAEVDRLLAGEPGATMGSIASWADELRGSDPELGKRSARWHYVNIGEADCQYEPQQHCPDGDCVVAALQAQSAILADRSRSEAERRQALKFVVHLVGDIHQPLHAGHAHDVGGNRHQVRLDNTGTNLHALWDSGLINAPRPLGSEAAAVEADLPPASAATPGGKAGKSRSWTEEEWLTRLLDLPLDAGSLELAGNGPGQPWAEQSCKLVLKDGFYPPKGASIDQTYIQSHLPQVEVQLKLAGVRLASLLETLLVEPAVDAATQ